MSKAARPRKAKASNTGERIEPEWEKPRRRRVKKVERVAQEERSVLAKTVGPQWLFREKVSDSSYKTSKMVISVDDKRFLSEGSNAFVFVLQLKFGWVIRVASERAVTDFELSGAKAASPAKVLNGVLKILREDKFKSALVLGDRTIVDIISGRKARMGEEEAKSHKAASRQKVSSEVLPSDKTLWQNRQLAQMAKLKSGYVRFEWRTAEGILMNIFI